MFFRRNTGFVFKVQYISVWNINLNTARYQNRLTWLYDKSLYKAAFYYAIQLIACRLEFLCHFLRSQIIRAEKITTCVKSMRARRRLDVPSLAYPDLVNAVHALVFLLCCCTKIYDTSFHPT